MITLHETPDGGFIARAELIVRLEGERTGRVIGEIVIDLEEINDPDRPRKAVSMPDGSVVAAIRRMLDEKGV